MSTFFRLSFSKLFPRFAPQPQMIFSSSCQWLSSDLPGGLWTLTSICSLGTIPRMSHPPQAQHVPNPSFSTIMNFLPSKYAPPPTFCTFINSTLQLSNQYHKRNLNFTFIQQTPINYQVLLIFPQYLSSFFHFHYNYFHSFIHSTNTTEHPLCARH